MNILYFAPANSVHSHKWINSMLEDCQIYWISHHQTNQPIDNRINYCEINLKNILSIFNCIKILINIRRGGSIDICHVHSLCRYLLIPVIFRYLIGGKLVLTAWGSDVLLPTNSIIVRVLQNLAWRWADAVTSDSHVLCNIVKDRVSRAGNINCNIYKINFGIDINFFKPDGRKKRYAVSGSSVLRIISTRNHEPIYDLGTLIDALGLLKKRNIAFSAQIFGNGGLSMILQNQVKLLGLDDRVTFPGPVSQKELRDALQSADIYVSTSLSDAGLAASTAEAMACGLIPIVSQVADNKEWVTDDIGFTFQAGNSQDLFDKLRSALESFKDPGHETRSANARRCIIDHNSINFEMAKMKRIYRIL